MGEFKHIRLLFTSEEKWKDFCICICSGYLPDFSLGRAQGKPGTFWRDYVSRLAWECLPNVFGSNSRGVGRGGQGKEHPDLPRQKIAPASWIRSSKRDEERPLRLKNKTKNNPFSRKQRLAVVCLDDTSFTCAKKRIFHSVYLAEPVCHFVFAVCGFRL